MLQNVNMSNPMRREGFSKILAGWLISKPFILCLRLNIGISIYKEL